MSPGVIFCNCGRETARSVRGRGGREEGGGRSQGQGLRRLAGGNGIGVGHGEGGGVMGERWPRCELNAL